MNLLHDLIDLYILKQSHLAKTTKGLVSTILNSFMKFSGGFGSYTSPADIPDVQYFRYLDSLENGGTYNHRLSVLNRFREYLGKPRLDATKKRVDELDINPTLIKENYEKMIVAATNPRERMPSRSSGSSAIPCTTWNSTRTPT